METSKQKFKRILCDTNGCPLTIRSILTIKPTPQQTAELCNQYKDTDQCGRECSDAFYYRFVAK